jgi:hypothetical protein
MLWPAGGGVTSGRDCRDAVDAEREAGLRISEMPQPATNVVDFAMSDDSDESSVFLSAMLRDNDGTVICFGASLETCGNAWTALAAGERPGVMPVLMRSGVSVRSRAPSVYLHLVLVCGSRALPHDSCAIPRLTEPFSPL